MKAYSHLREPLTHAWVLSSSNCRTEKTKASLSITDKLTGYAYATQSAAPTRAFMS